MTILQPFLQLHLFKRLCVFIISLLLMVSSPAQQPVTSVLVARAELAEIVEEVPLTGTVVSSRMAKLSTEISGLIDSIDVDIGDQVKTGTEILRLNADLEKLALQAKQAETKQARQELEDARRRLNDAEKLGKNLSVSVNEIQSLAAEVKIDATFIKRIQAEQQQQALRVRKHILKAPFNGVISQKLVEQGEWVVPGQAIVELISNDRLFIEFQVPQSVYSRLDKIARLTIHFEALPESSYESKIVAIVPVTDRSSRTFLVRAVLTDQQVKLIPGISASAVLQIKSATQGVIVTRNAILRYPDGRITVWVVNNNDGKFTVSEKQVQTGLSFDGKISITDGLDHNEMIVIEGNESLREGQVVKLHNRIE